MKKLLLLLASVLMCSACSSPKPETGNEKPAEETVSETVKKALSSEEMLDQSMNQLGLTLYKIENVHISVPDNEDNVKISFTVEGTEYFCKINQYTGEMTEHNIPEEVIQKTREAADPMEQAINAAFSHVEGYSGGAEDIKVHQEGTVIVVEFNWNGEHYTLHYDMNEGKITD